MTPRYLLLSILLASWSGVTTVASAQHAHTMTEQSERPMPMDSGATALLTGPSGLRSPNGIAVVDKQLVRITWSGDQPGGSRRWQLHEGSCSGPGPIVAVQNGYSPIVVDAGGVGSGTAMLLAPLDGAMTYLAAIREDGANTLGALIACGSIDRVGAGARAVQDRMDPGMADMADMDHSAAGVSPTGAQRTPPDAPMDHSRMGHADSGPDSASMKHAPAISPVMMQLHMRMMADPVICRRVMADTAMRRMMKEMVDEVSTPEQGMLHGKSCESTPSTGGSAAQTPGNDVLHRPESRMKAEAFPRATAVQTKPTEARSGDVERAADRSTLTASEYRT